VDEERYAIAKTAISPDIAAFTNLNTKRKMQIEISPI
jgi:hypothetical protein